MSKTKVVTFENLAEYDQLNKDFHSGNQNTLYALAKAHTADMIADVMDGTKVVAKATNATTSEDASKLGGELPSYYAKATDIPTGSLAKKSSISESDLDSALAEKVNSASQGNHSHSNKTVLDGITSTKVSNWDSAESNAKSYTDEKIALLMENPTEVVDSIIELRDAIEALREVAGSKVPTSRTVNGKALTGDISIGISDIPNLQTTLNNASDAINTNTASISGHTTRIASLKEKVGDGFEEVTSAEIQSLFP